MLRRLFALRPAAIPSHHAFRWRGNGVSRIEGLSDAVFGFAITLLVVSLEVPKTVADLLVSSRAFVPFVASFLVLFSIWRAQFHFFRRYGLEDETTVWLTGALLVMVLFLVYPLKFLFTLFGSVLMSGGATSVKDTMHFDDFPKVLGLYATGFFGVMIAFALLYGHAARQREVLQLTALELFDTVSMQRRWQHGAIIAGTLLAWCLSLIAIGDHRRARDNVFDVVYVGGYTLVLLSVFWRLLARRSSRRDRRALAERHDDSIDAVEPRPDVPIIDL
ncbi:MAG: TMEM175 family protein [bacterium]